MRDEAAEHGSGPTTDRVARAIELRDQGYPNWLERACADAPEKRPEVLEAIGFVDALHEHFVDGLARDARIETRLDGRYRLLERLGAGAMGVVYAAEDAVLGREVAIKILRRGLVAPERSHERFEGEARALAAVSHPSVVPIFERGRTPDDESYLVMERLRGASLQTVLEELSAAGTDAHRISSDDVARDFGLALPTGETFVRTGVRWVAELAEGVAAAHEAGIIHRDIKPSNVFVRRDGRAVLLDFGIARMLEAETLTEHDSSVGTPAYIAPECIGDRAGASASSDVYGLTAVLYSLLALRPPFVGAPTKVLLEAATGSPEPLPRHHPGLARDLLAIVEKGMERDPRRRYASPAELRADLVAFLEHRPVSARPVGPLRRTGRRLLRSATARTLLVLLGLATVGGIAFAVDASLRSARAEAWATEWRGLPPNFAIVRPENREVRADEDRERLSERLDRLVATAADPLPSRLLRASFLLDHGDLAGAAADMAAIARTEGTPLARALAAAYAAVEPGSAGSDAVDTADLPAPQGARDRFLRAWHHLRAFEDPQAAALLDEEVRALVPFAEELRFALTGFGRLDPQTRRARALALASDVRLYEQRTVGRTATTAHFLAFARGHANDYPGSLAAARESVALAPRSHVNRTNAGWSAFALGRIAESREHLEVALDVRPNDFRPAQTLVWTHVAEGDHEGAHAALERVAPALDGRVPGWSEQFALTIEAYRALALWTAAREEGRDPADDSQLRRAVDRARAHADEARALGIAEPAPLSLALVDAVLSDDDEAVFAALVRDHAGESRGLWSLSLIERHLPARIGPDSTPLLAELLATLHEEFSGATVLPR